MTSKIISTIKSDGSIHKVHQEEQNSKKKNAVFQYREFGFYLVTPILLGTFLGVYLDKYFQTKPVFTIFLLILGTIGTFYNLVKIVKDENATH